MAVDAAVGRVGGADAGGQKDDLLAVAACLGEPLDDGLLQVEDLIDGRRHRRG